MEKNETTKKTTEYYVTKHDNTWGIKYQLLILTLKK